MSNEYTPDTLVQGGWLDTAKKKLLNGQSVVRGSVVGLVTKGAATAAYGSNTGDGTISAVILGADAKVGDYTLKCVAESAGAGTFSVTDPDGYRLQDVVVAVAYANDHLAFTIAGGDEDWNIGDEIVVTVAAGSGEAKVLSKDAVDGSAIPWGIAVQPADAALAAIENVEFYISGKFDRTKLVFVDDGTDYEDVEDAFRALGVILVSPTQEG